MVSLALSSRHAQKYNMLIVTIHFNVFSPLLVFFFIDLIRGLVVSLSALYSTVAQLLKIGSGCEVQKGLSPRPPPSS